MPRGRSTDVEGDFQLILRYFAGIIAVASGEKARRLRLGHLNSDSLRWWCGSLTAAAAAAAAAALPRPRSLFPLQQSMQERNADAADLEKLDKLVKVCDARHVDANA